MLSQIKPQAPLLVVPIRPCLFFQGLPGPLKDYFPRSSPGDLTGNLREERAGEHLDPGFDVAPSGAASTTTSRTTYGQRLQPHAVEWRGGDPKTDYSGVVLVDGSLPFSFYLGDNGISPRKEGLATPTATVSGVPAFLSDTSRINRSPFVCWFG